MSAPRVIACRAVVSARYPDASFLLQVPRGCHVELACATDPRLFALAARPLRSDGNFFAAGAASRRGDAAVVVPAPIVRRFAGAPRLYYVAAATSVASRASVALSLPADALHRAPWVRLAPDLARAARIVTPLAHLQSRLGWAGDRLLGDDFDSDDEDDGPPPLAKNQVVAIEVRDPSGAVTTYTHEYPVKADPTAGESGGVVITLPDLAPLKSPELKLVDLRKQISTAFVAASLYPSVSVNARLAQKAVTYEQPVNAGDTLWVRILGKGGVPDKASGSYPVNDGGEIDLPYLGILKVGGNTLADVEADLLKRVSDARLLAGAVIDLSQDELK